MLRWDLTITTGLSAKNLVIYLVATFLALRMVIARTSIMAAAPMQAAFLIQIKFLDTRTSVLPLSALLSFVESGFSRIKRIPPS